MPVIALKPGYSFPSRSRLELYGDDMLIHVMWKGNFLFAAPATFRAPQSLPWNDFVTDVIAPWASMDSGFDPARAHNTWTLDGKAFEPVPNSSLVELGVGHKSLITFEA